MNPEVFTSQKTGNIIRVSASPPHRFAFVPNELPIEWHFSERVWEHLVEASTAIASLNGVGKYIPNPRLFLQPMRRREAQLSSKLEGTITTPKQQLLFELDAFTDSNTAELENLKEVQNYLSALEYYSTETFPVSIRLIKNLHRILLADVRGNQHEAGQFRRGFVQIGRPSRYVPPPPGQFEECLYGLETYIHTPKRMHKLIEAFIVHYQFEAIHPFNDGNGRVGRILLAIMIAKACDLSHSWLYMSPYFEANRDEYINRLFEISTAGKWEEWLIFCLKGAIAQAKDTEDRYNRLINLKEQFTQEIRQAGGSQRLLHILDLLFTSPVIQTTQIASLLDVSYSTAKSDIERLVEVDILTEIEGAKQKTFVNPHILNIIFEGTE